MYMSNVIQNSTFYWSQLQSIGDHPLVNLVSEVRKRFKYETKWRTKLSYSNVPLLNFPKFIQICAKINYKG